MIYLFLADGFETIEALAPLDMLRRAGIEVQTVGVTGKTVNSAHKVPVQADLKIDEITTRSLEGVILPGGSVGTENLDGSPVVHQYLDYCNQNQLMIAAICAAPSILGKKGFIDEKQATAFPTFQEYIPHYSDAFVVTDGHIITARGAGVSIAFGLEIVGYLKNQVLAQEIREAIQCIN